MRADRLISLLLLLQARGRLTADALAAELEVSVRTIYRDIEALQASGVPLYGDPGHDGGYSLIGGYRTRLTGFNRDEVAALSLTALPGPAAELGLGNAVSTASRKIKAALSDELREQADHVEQRLHVDPRDWYVGEQELPFLAAVADALWRQRRLRARYRRWQAPREVERTLEPFGLVLKAGRWYLVARHEGRLRTYRVSHLLGVEILDEPFDRPNDFDLAEHWRSSLVDFDRRRHLGEATVRLSPRALERLPDLAEPAIVQAVTASAGATDAEGWVQATIPIESLEHAHDELLRLGADVEALAPPELRESLARTSSALASRYQSVRPVQSADDGR